MPVKSEWDLDPGSLQTLQFDSNVLNISNEDNAAEFYGACPLGISPPGTVPNDDIWKKFGLGDDFYDDIDFGICEDFATAATTWMNPTYTKTTRGEIMNHDCMWAGHCVSDKHDRKVENKTNWTAFVPIKKPLMTPTVTPKPEEPKVIAVTTPDGTMTPDGGKICVKKNAVVAPTHARSLLLPTRIINNNQTTNTPMQKTNNNISISNISANRCNSRSKTLDSRGESPRPETPQSLSDSEDLDIDLMDLPTVEDVVDLYGADMADMYNDIVKDIGGLSDFSDDVDFYSDESDSSVSKCSSPSKVTAVSPSKVTGFKVVSRTNVNPVSNGNSNTNISNSNSNNPVTVKQEVPISRHYTTNSYFSDHCYHLSKNARMDHLGVQTPSDSEEEIDVETVYGDSKKPNSRSSSTGGVLPTNPSFSDRQQLQLTVASAIHNKKEVKKASARTSSVPNRYDLDERTLKPNKIVACKRGKNSVKNGELRRTNKRSAQFDDYEYLTTKSVKRKKSQYQRHFKSGKSKKSKTRRNQSRTSGGSSESEEDSSQKRSMHNSMERQRRIDLRNAFEELRKLVPKTADNEKAAKVVILSFGAQHCLELTQKEAEYQRKAADLRRQQEMLRAKLSHLRRYIFKMRE